MNRNGWQIKSLGEVAEFIRTGKTPSTKKEDYFNGEIQWYTPSDIGESKYLEESTRTLTQKGVTEGKALIFPKDTLLITCIGNIGRVGILQYDGSSNQQITGIKFNSNIDVDYAYFWFRKNSHHLIYRANKAIVPILNNSQLREIKIEYPPLPVQKQIAEILEKADQAKQKRKEANKLTEQCLQSAFIEMFGDPVKNPKGWEMKKLGDFIGYIGDIGSNGSNENVSKNLVMVNKEDYAIMVRTVNLSSNDFTKNLKYVSKTTYEYFSKSKIYGGEIIMNKIGSAGDFWIMPNFGRPVSLGLNQLVIRPRALNTVYLYYYLSTNYGQVNIKSQIRGAITKSITKSAVKNLPLLYPPLSFQQQFAELVQKTETLKEKQKASEKELENLFNSLMQKAFKGELVG